MTTLKNLATFSGRYYEHLAPSERVRLVLEAQKRGDDAEATRLFDSAPARMIDLKHHQLGETVLHTLALVYVSEQLEAAGAYFFAAMKIVGGVEDLADEELRFLLFCYDVHAYVFHIKAQAWRKACEGLGLDPDHLVQSNYLGWLLPFCEGQMGTMAPSRERLEERFRDLGYDPTDLITVESQTESWRGLLKRAIP